VRHIKTWHYTQKMAAWHDENTTTVNHESEIAEEFT
jgi:hypothetical protein